MKSSDPDTCPRCGALIPAGSKDGSCPACLMSGALKGPAEETVVMTPDPAPPPTEPTEFPRAFGGYRLLGQLGRGGMGSVYDAEESATGRRVALKMLSQRLDSPDMRHRFLREGRLAAGVNHPNSLYVFGSEEIEDMPVITMEIAGGGTLRDELRQRGPLPVTEAVDAMLDVIAGLEAACTAGVLHRDIKPSNCFVGPDGSVKIGDFGLSVSTLARDDSFNTASGIIMGTPAFASPEQLRGDPLDLRTDIYSVGATLFALLTGKPPFEGENAVQVVANAISQSPPELGDVLEDLPPGLGRVVSRCLAKEPEGRYGDYMALRNALLPFSSREPEPAPLTIRAAAGWIDYLIALLPPYLALMFTVGAETLLIQPLLDRTLWSARYYLVLFAFAFLYFGITEGIWGAGLGKWLRGLRVTRANGRAPGIGRALLRIVIPIGCIEGVRIPLMLVTLPRTEWSSLDILWFTLAANLCAWLPVLLTLRARGENGFATFWDVVSGTRVVIRQTGAERPSLQTGPQADLAAEGTGSLGPYRITGDVVPGGWLSGTDPVLRRDVWLLRRTSTDLSPARRQVARPGRLRWLQSVEDGGTTWDAFEATQGVPFAGLAEEGKQVPWGTVRYWLHDLASELWAATGDDTLPRALSTDHVWITHEGRAILLDEPWPVVASPAEPVSVEDIAGQQRFLASVADCVESTGVPLHARPALNNLKEGRFEKLSFLTGTLQGLLDRPAEVGRGIRAGSIFMLAVYAWVMVFAGAFHDRLGQDSVAGSAVVSALAVLGIIAVIQLVSLAFRCTASQAIFRLAVVNAQGEPAAVSRLLVRWMIVWLPLFVTLAAVIALMRLAGGTSGLPMAALLLLWMGAAVYAVVHPRRGLQDRWAGTWVVRR